MKEYENAGMVGFSAYICSVFSADAVGIARNGRPDLNVSIVQRRVSTQR
jgi:hypothetical protein